ncbi:unnamed protein product [Moneuplotes crassus]|uniref:Uncharacterized protein n=1 Tax=Euplotes crassus TaxID=5936 RepID=A0AAD1X2S7_EUPCR|nr:unnamed protein product [Moneuplotes crassus]
MSETIPDRLNFYKKRTERKRTGRSLEKFSSNHTTSSNITLSNSRARINSVFRFKLQNLNDARNQKKMSQSMVRSKRFDTNSDQVSSQRDASEEKNSPIILKKHRVLKNRFAKPKGHPKIEEQKSIQGISKGPFQGIITPVVQISYNQIRSEKEILIKHSSQPEKQNKASLKSQHEVPTYKQPKLMSDQHKREYEGFLGFKILKDEKRNSGDWLGHGIDRAVKEIKEIDEEVSDGVDECMPGENMLTNRANSVNESFQMNKRSLSEMRRSCEVKVVVNKPSCGVFSKLKDRNKNQMLTTLNAVKVVSINNLTDSTKSGERSNTGRGVSGRKGISSDINIKLNPTPESGSLMLNTSCNNNSISSLKLSEKNCQIDLVNQTKLDPVYSPLARDRSHTINSNKEKTIQKCKSSKSISSTGKVQKDSSKPSKNIFQNTPFKNIKLSSRKRQNKGTPGPSNLEYEEFGGKCRFLQKSRGVNRKEKVSGKASHLAKNNDDVQKVRDAILSSIDNSNTEYGAYERRKLRFLNSIDENKDLDLLKNKFRESQHKRKEKSHKNEGGILEKCMAVKNSLDLHFKNKPQMVPEQEPSIEEKVPATLRKFGGKNDSVQKVQVYLSTECNIDSSVDNIRDKKQENNTEAMKPLSIRPKEHASLFKSKNITTSKQGCKRSPIITTEKRRRLGPYKCKNTQKKLERYLRPTGL